MNIGSGRRRAHRRSTEEISPARLALRYGPRALLAVAVLMVPISWVVGGWRAAAGAAAGLLVVAGFFAVSVVLVEAANRVHPSMTLPVALTEYSVKVIVLGAVAFAVPDSWGNARPAFAFGLIIGTLAWLVSQALGVWRAPLRYVDMSLAAPDRRPANR
jgi:ATP synthase protein I